MEVGIQAVADIRRTRGNIISAEDGLRNPVALALGKPWSGVPRNLRRELVNLWRDGNCDGCGVAFIELFVNILQHFINDVIGITLNSQVSIVARFDTRFSARDPHQERAI